MRGRGDFLAFRSDTDVPLSRPHATQASLCLSVILSARLLAFYSTDSVPRDAYSMSRSEDSKTSTRWILSSGRLVIAPSRTDPAFWVFCNKGEHNSKSVLILCGQDCRFVHQGLGPLTCLLVYIRIDSRQHLTKDWVTMLFSFSVTKCMFVYAYQSRSSLCRLSHFHVIQIQLKFMPCYSFHIETSP